MEVCKIKYEKNTIPCRMPNVTNPTKYGLEQMRIELRMLNVFPEPECWD